MSSSAWDLKSRMHEVGIAANAACGDWGHGGRKAEMEENLKAEKGKVCSRQLAVFRKRGEEKLET